MISWFKRHKPEPEPRKNFVPEFQVRYRHNRGFYVTKGEGFGEEVLSDYTFVWRAPQCQIDYFKNEFDAIEAVYIMACKDHQEYLTNKRLEQIW
jgi:hypothetical protein